MVLRAGACWPQIPRGGVWTSRTTVLRASPRSRAAAWGHRSPISRATSVSVRGDAANSGSPAAASSAKSTPGNARPSVPRIRVTSMASCSGRRARQSSLVTRCKRPPHQQGAHRPPLLQQVDQLGRPEVPQP